MNVKRSRCARAWAILARSCRELGRQGSKNSARIPVVPCLSRNLLHPHCLGAFPPGQPPSSIPSRTKTPSEYTVIPPKSPPRSIASPSPTERRPQTNTPPRRAGVASLQHGFRRLQFNMRKDASTTMSRRGLDLAHHRPTLHPVRLLRALHRGRQHHHLRRRSRIRPHLGSHNAGHHDIARAE